jgi:5'(3')-deoxyribonucleotidase
MNKPKLFLDMDNTLTNSTKAFCESYNYIYKYHKDFKPAQWRLVKKWNFEDQCKNLNSHSDVLEIFENPIFFKFLKLINHNTYEVVRELNEKYQIIVISIGTPKNLSLKSLYLNDTLPFIKDYILLNNENCEMNKSIIQMNYPNSIFIEDVTTNLDSSNAQNKYIFGEEYPWSQTNGYKRLWNWTEVAEKLLQ